ncbi:MAG TPA: chemotaxis-specific protein-glutamate methyltransferase CheB [Gemmatimonadales bacterium]|nr:chemotaxis-specific protein-glutamate methyltransferase CheB [Gemmatimonadales bacterium]
MLPLRVLVVDDAVIVRRLVMQTLAADPEFEVLGSASTGLLALERIETLTPDVVTLDLDMPEMDGFEALRRIRAKWPALPVLVFTGAYEDEIVPELEALGASATLRKLPHEGNMRGAIGWVREMLVPALKALPRQARPAPPAERIAAAVASPAGSRPARAPAVLGIGASTGGPNALETLLGALPADLGVPILVVQHMPDGFTRLLAERLSAKTPFEATEARQGDILAPDRIWIAPGDRHLYVERSREGIRLQTSSAPPENSCRPAVDVLFRSLAEVFGDGTLAVVLTGMGQDGMLGAERVVRMGGRVLAQDEASSVVWGMPGAVARAGLADRVLPLTDLPAEIAARVRGAGAFALNP